MTIKKSTVSEVKMQQGRKLAFQLVVGALIGGLSSYFGLGLLGAENVTVDQLAVGGVGLIYLLIGVICGFGLIAPKLGASILNVEDADEIRDQSRILSGSAICMIALGAALMALTMAGPHGPISGPAAMGGLLAALALLIAVSIRDWNYYDEMMLQLSRDAGNIAFSGVGSVTLVWGSASWLGLVTAPTPLALVALTSGGFLMAIFVASARKGLMQPR
ncbi:hypothetical protein [Sphingorhabdus sp.]|jgi:hypothetical protein|uniref:hypothetical protein n=1 Tax=Sphingorhabdus sp. TaxID=1902408 RepID=UPI003784038E